MPLVWFSFYPKDWLSDPNLSRCSLQAQGAWIRMICLMWDCEHRGVLATGGKAWTKEQVCKAIGFSTAEAGLAIDELVEFGVVRVFKQTITQAEAKAKQNESIIPDGSYCSARVIREAEISRIRSEAGRKGGRPKSKPKANLESKPEPTPKHDCVCRLSSSSSSSSLSGNEKDDRQTKPAGEERASAIKEAAWKAGIRSEASIRKLVEDPEITVERIESIVTRLSKACKFSPGLVVTCLVEHDWLVDAPKTIEELHAAIKRKQITSATVDGRTVEFTPTMKWNHSGILSDGVVILTAKEMRSATWK